MKSNSFLCEKIYFYYKDLFTESNIQKVKGMRCLYLPLYSFGIYKTCGKSYLVDANFKGVHFRLVVIPQEPHFLISQTNPINKIYNSLEKTKLFSCMGNQ